MTPRRDPFLRSLLLALITLALLSVPFAHRAGAAPVSAQMTQVLAMGGSLADICGAPGVHLSGGCEACRIVGAMALPAAPQLGLPLRHAGRAVHRPADADPARHAFARIKPPVRAPPARLMPL